MEAGGGGGPVVLGEGAFVGGEDGARGVSLACWGWERGVSVFGKRGERELDSRVSGGGRGMMGLLCDIVREIYEAYPQRNAQLEAKA